tara:strand:- start:11057 stop:11308 length:252 start_codon:yes stop_codon:yes gene_type:complete
LGTPSDAGGFLDITLDFIFYQAVVFAFGLADPANLSWALLLMLSFVGTGISFLAFAVMAASRIRYGYVTLRAGHQQSSACPDP